MKQFNSLSPLEHPLPANSRFFFLHIPKTAGTTFNAILKRHFGSKNYRWLLFPWDITDLPDHNLEAYRYYSGHLDYDLMRTLLPDSNNMVWVTFLREPVAHFLSLFAFIQRFCFSPAADKRHAAWFGSFFDLYRLNVTEFVEHPAMPVVAQNRQTLMLGSNFQFRNYRELTDSLAQLPQLDFASYESLRVNNPAEVLLAQAKQRLVEAAFFGLTERFQDSLQLLAYTFGWRPQPNDLRLNAATSRPRQAELCAGRLARIIEVNQLDLELYAYAQQLFETRFTRMSYELLEQYGGLSHAHLKPPLSSETLTELLDKHYVLRLTQRQTPVRSFTLKLDDALTATGWHGPEPHPRHGLFSWSGPGNRSTIDLMLRPGYPARVIFSIMAAITPQTLDSLQLQVNGQPVGLNRYLGREETVVFVGHLPTTAIADDSGFARLTFELDQALSPGALTGKGDSRSLGIALNQLEVHPVEAEDSGWADACRRLIAPEVLEHLPHLLRSTDIITPGRGWYPLESYQGETFYWANNNAELIIHAPTGQHTRLSLEVEPGPGLPGQPLQLQLRDAAGRVVAVTPKIRGRQVVKFRLPLRLGPAMIFRLHVAGGGRPTSDDSRILNFRMFHLGWGSTEQENGESKKCAFWKKIRISNLAR